MGSESKEVRWAYNVGISLAFLPISLSGLLYFVGEGTRPLRFALLGLSAVGWIILTFVKRAMLQESVDQPIETGGPAADDIPTPRP